MNFLKQFLKPTFLQLYFVRFTLKSIFNLNHTTELSPNYTISSKVVNLKWFTSLSKTDSSSLSFKIYSRLLTLNFLHQPFSLTSVKNISLYITFKTLFLKQLLTFKKSIGDGFLYLRGLFILCFIDAALTDDEPLWEPIEWSLVQSWLIFVFFSHGLLKTW